MFVRTNLVELLDRSSERRPRHTALVDGEREWSYASLRDEVRRTASLLREIGVRRGDRVGISLQKSAEEVIATLAVAAVRAVFVNINLQSTVEQLFHVIDDAGIEVLVTDRRRALAIGNDQRQRRLRHVVVVDDASDVAKAVAWADRSESASPTTDHPLGNDLAALLYTSGSTGRPKGVVISHGTLVRGAEIIGTYLQSQEDDRVLSVPPLSFDYGLNQLVTTLMVGATLVLQRVPLPAEIAKTVRRFSVTGLPLVAPGWVQLIRYLGDEQAPLTGLRYATNTGGKIPLGILEQMPTALPGASIYLMYGLTEAFRSTYLPPGLFASKMGAMGRAIPNVEIFVVHPERGLCGPNEIGELIHRGDLISLGYWKQPEATQRVIKTCEALRPLIGDERVLHSGDWVRCDEDGILWYVGRMDAMIKCSGYRISPTEIEEAVCGYDGVNHAVAFGVADDELGQVVHVAIEWNGSQSAASALETYLRACLPHHMIPRRIHSFATAMPRTSTGKIDRQRVVEDCRDR